MAEIGKIEVNWKKSEHGEVCTASAFSKKGEVLAKTHITLPCKITTEFYRAYGSLGKDEIERAAQIEVQFILDHPELFQ
jgi:hypothetical protein